MGRKGGKYKKKENSGLVKNKMVQLDYNDEDMNDEIDAFHKSRDVVPLNISNDVEESDEDIEQPVFEIEDQDEDENDEDEDIDDENKPLKGLEAKIARTGKFLRTKFGVVDDELLDDTDEEDQEKVVWARKKDMYGPNELQSSDDEGVDEEEKEVLRLQREKLKVLSEADYGLEDSSEDETHSEPTFEEILDHGKPSANTSIDKGVKAEDGMAYEIIKKDLNALTKEEQMDLVSSSAPELFGLLSELNDALEQLENKVTPFVDKIRGSESSKKGGMHYLEVKQYLLQSYCQAITFYLLLKSEGKPARDHPVVGRLMEIKKLMDMVKEIDEKLTFDVEDIVNKDVNNSTVIKLVEENAAVCEKQALIELVKASDFNTSRSLKNIEAHGKHQDKQVGAQSIEMLKIRASLDEKLKQKGVYISTDQKIGRTIKHMQQVNRQLETLDDFVDEATEIDAQSHSSKALQQRALRPNKRKVISGDDDIPKQDDIGERRRKHELRVLAGAGIESVEDDETMKISGDKVNEESDTDSGLEYYNQVGREHAAKLAAKSNKFNTRTVEVPSLSDTVIDGKRDITNQMQKNRGLTRSRNKLKKNPRKNNRMKHEKAKERRKGQVRPIRKPAGPYGGEITGINANVTASRRFNS